MTIENLKETDRFSIHRNSITNKINKKKQEDIDYINSFDDAIKEQFIKVLNGPINEIGIEQIKLKCKFLRYDLEKEVKYEEE